MIISFRESLELLQLQPGYDERQLKSAYRKAAHKHHPDKGGDVEKFKQLKAAYDFLLPRIGMVEQNRVQGMSVNINVHRGANGAYSVTFNL